MTMVAGGGARTPLADRPNSAHWFAGRLHEVLDGLTDGGVAVMDLDAQEVGEAVTELFRGAERLNGLALELLGHADTVDVAATAEPVATSTGAWLAQALTEPRGHAERLVKLSRRMNAEFAATRDGVTAGRADVEQAQVIVAAVDALPSCVGADLRRRAEGHLIGEAERHDARQLKLLGKHLLHVVDPNAADAELAKRLASEEADAARRTMLRLRDDGAGTCHGTFRIPSLYGAMLTVALDALASPRRPDAIDRQEPIEAGSGEAAGGEGDPGEVVATARTRTAPEVLGQAFCELLERFPTTELPRTGGGLATVLVTIGLEVLEGRLGVATLSTGGTLTAGAVRRLACHHGLIPQVLGAKSQPLDLGRKTRLHTEPQRIAMIARDVTCTAEGCTIPAAWCHAHHRIPWASGGGTSVKDGRMVCPRHHRLLHHPGYAADYLSNGRIHIIRLRQ